VLSTTKNTLVFKKNAGNQNGRVFVGRKFGFRRLKINAEKNWAQGRSNQNVSMKGEEKTAWTKGIQTSHTGRVKEYPFVRERDAAACTNLLKRRGLVERNSS
jgi:hypothetical protein